MILGYVNTCLRVIVNKYVHMLWQILKIKKNPSFATNLPSLSYFLQIFINKEQCKTNQFSIKWQHQPYICTQLIAYTPIYPPYVHLPNWPFSSKHHAFSVRLAANIHIKSSYTPSTRRLTPLSYIATCIPYIQPLSKVSRAGVRLDLTKQRPGVKLAVQLGLLVSNGQSLGYLPVCWVLASTKYSNR